MIAEAKVCYVHGYVFIGAILTSAKDVRLVHLLLSLFNYYF